jgi:type II secretory pathway component PulJ
MDRNGQALIEYVILLVLFSMLAIQGWQLLRPALNDAQHTLELRRSGVQGMYP